MEKHRRAGCRLRLRPGLAGLCVRSVSGAWTEQTLHFIDFEGSLGSGILEYGVVSLRGGEILDTHTRLCRASGRVRRQDVAVHGLAEASVAGCEPFSGEFERFAALRASGPLAAHFAQAETTLLKAAWPYPRTSPDFLSPGGAVTDWGPWIDTGRLYPHLYPTLPSAKLEHLITTFGLQSRLDELAGRFCPPARRQYHAALYDALAGALLLQRLTGEPAVAGQSLAWLLTESTRDPVRRAALNQGELF